MNVTQEREKLRHYLSPREIGEHGFDARYSVPDIDLECRRAMEDLVAGCRPTTALGVLLEGRQKYVAKFPGYNNVDEMPQHLQRFAAVEEYTVSGLVRGYHPQVRWVLDDLVERGFAEHFDDDGLSLFMAKATLDRMEPLPNPYPSGPDGMSPGAL